MSKQNSVEWLESEITKRGPKENNPPQWLKELYEQAKAMHKQEIVDAYNESFRLRDKPYSTAVKYYNETFGGNNE